MNVQPVILEGPTIRLEPLTPEDAPRLWPGAGLELFQHTLDAPRDASLEAFADWLRLGLDKPDSLLFVILDRRTDEALGITGYLYIRSPHRGLEIGRTLIPRPFQGTRVNPESKLLLMRHAFEDLGAIRVQFTTDRNNLQSQRAIEKLGARRDGVLRKYQVRSNGTVRDTVVYSILEEEWPQVKAGLEERLANLA